jgi:hypothetical protein
MKTNLYGNRKAVDQLNSTNLSGSGVYRFCKPLVESKTVLGHFRIEFVHTVQPVLGNFGESLSTPVAPVEETQAPGLEQTIDRVDITMDTVYSTGKVPDRLSQEYYDSITELKPQDGKLIENNPEEITPEDLFALWNKAPWYKRIYISLFR